MDLLLVGLHVAFLVPLLVRIVGCKRGGSAMKSGLLAEMVASAREPVLIVQGVGLELLWVGVAIAFLQGRVPRAVTVRGVLGAVVLVCALVLITWSFAVLRSWRLLPRIDAGHELCTSGPYGLVRHPMYLALDLLGVGSALWAATAPVVAGAALLILGGDLRARREERALVEAFGDRYRSYMRRVRRTVPFLY